ncbi:MAG: D-tyrosyl-tRNA(Tyr) deacylase [Bacteroidales bacterium]|jgi:D-tyrosyl-tRNA(Tyr) deacylase|nr:D-tyrosyl-tRNA(Tyr) deacylase [Bacteroidales bacterium]MBR4689721.1 D-tyrosyl-tRNA(Tyr) deacylase [Bacteroidales bacterium]MBR7034719.1 D-tyrosyl-tRNA(Tyr) deacylase [Bacteroidales bacterium]
MRAVIQRVTRASVTIDGTLKSEIGTGFLVLLGVEDADTDEDLVWLSGKIARLRVFSDENDLMNLSLDDVHGDVLLVSQFTLFASTKKGNRPSYIRAARPEKAIPMYEAFIKQLQSEIQGKVVTGEFGADMKVDLLNDGPVTIIIDTKNKE